MFGKHALTPWILLTGIIAMLACITMTDLMQPLIGFIHNEQGSAWQMALCIFFSILGFRVAYKLLYGICNFYSDKFDARATKTIMDNTSVRR